MDSSTKDLLHIVSWNVASWATTLVKIKQRHGSLESWLGKHNVDILCIQEVKITCNDICYKSRDLCATELGGYESFWAYPHNGATAAVSRSTSTNSSSSSSKTSSSVGQGAGLNGVATFARSGYTQRACARALRSDILDNEGRCLMTDHGSFVIFNVYVPNSGDNCKRFPFKLKFLHALEAAVAIEKAKGKMVIIAGDFNIAARSCDVTRYYRLLNIAQLVNENPFMVSLSPADNVDNWESSSRSDYLLFDPDISTYYCRGLARYLSPTEVNDCRDAVVYLRTVWPTVQRALITARNEQENGKYRVVADRPVDGKQGKIGRLSVYPTHEPFNMKEMKVADSQTEEEFLVRHAGCLHIGDIVDAIKALVTWSPLTDTRFNNPEAGLLIGDVLYQNQLSELSNRHWNILSDVFGRPPHGEATVQWLRGIMQRHALVDTFAEARPYVRNYRFTCWEQYTNRRYANEGSRIDMMLIDRDCWNQQGVIGRELSGFDACLAKAATGIDEGKNPIIIPTTLEDTTNNNSSLTSLRRNFLQKHKQHIYSDQLQCEAALAACTGEGMFIPAPMTGGGIPSASPRAYEHQFLGSPHTGIIYTPPEFSDHVAISLCLSTGSTCDYSGLGSYAVASDADTKFTQPFRQQKSITSMFQKQKQLSSSSPTSQSSSQQSGNQSSSQSSSQSCSQVTETSQSSQSSSQQLSAPSKPLSPPKQPAIASKTPTTNNNVSKSVASFFAKASSSSSNRSPSPSMAAKELLEQQPQQQQQQRQQQQQPSSSVATEMKATSALIKSVVTVTESNSICVAEDMQVEDSKDVKHESMTMDQSAIVDMTEDDEDHFIVDNTIVSNQNNNNDNSNNSVEEILEAKSSNNSNTHNNIGNRNSSSTASATATASSVVHRTTNTASTATTTTAVVSTKRSMGTLFDHFTKKSKS